MHNLSEEYFLDRQEQAKIQMAIYNNAIEEGQHYHNIIKALSDVLNQMIAEWVKDENDGRWHKESTQ